MNGTESLCSTVAVAEQRIRAYEALLQAARVPAADQAVPPEETSVGERPPLPEAEFVLEHAKVAFLERIKGGAQNLAVPSAEEVAALDLAGARGRRALAAAEQLSVEKARQLADLKNIHDKHRIDVTDAEEQMARVTVDMRQALETMKLLAAMQAGESLERWTSDLGLLDGDGIALLVEHLESTSLQLEKQTKELDVVVDSLRCEIEPRKMKLAEIQADLEQIKGDKNQEAVEDQEMQQMRKSYESYRLLNALVCQFRGWTWEPSQDDSDLREALRTLQVGLNQDAHRLSVEFENNGRGQSRVRALTLQPPSVNVHDVLQITSTPSMAVYEVEKRLNSLRT